MDIDRQFEQAWTLFDIAERAEIVISERPSSPLDYEITGDGESDYYLARTIPGDEDRALNWLCRRGFGAFKAEQRRRNSAGVPIKNAGLEPIFPGWLFVFYRDTKSNRERLLRVPGVIGLLCYPGTDRPVPADRHKYKGREISFVATLRRISEDERRLAGAKPHGGHAAVRCNRKVIRLSTHQRKMLGKLKDEARSRELFNKQEWEQINALALHERIAALKRALAVPSQVKVSSGTGG